MAELLQQCGAFTVWNSALARPAPASTSCLTFSLGGKSRPGARLGLLPPSARVLPSALSRQRLSISKGVYPVQAVSELATGKVSSAENASMGRGRQSLLSFLMEHSKGVDQGKDLALLLSQISVAVKRISASAARLGIVEGLQGLAKGGGQRNPSGDEQKALDVVADELMMAALQESGLVAVAASEESPDAVLLTGGSPFAVVFDPLDGSRNIDAGIPTGTIFGVYPASTGTASDALQPGTSLLCAGYALFSSATVLVLSLGKGAHGFTLDPVLGEFILTHPDVKMPQRGQIYSVNDARYFDWPKGLQQYIDTVRQGKGQSQKKYSARYICSLVGDFHRTLLYGGVAMNPRSHLRLVYEGNPLSFISEQAGGKGWDGHQRILSLKPEKLHQRLPLFLGSSEDIDEMASYGDVRQEVNPGYDV